MTMKEGIYRDVTFDKLSEADMGREIRVAGWVENIRDHGGITFVDLRDMYGELQVVLHDDALLKDIGREACVTV